MLRFNIFEIFYCGYEKEKVDFDAPISINLFEVYNWADVGKIRI